MTKQEIKQYLEGKSSLAEAQKVRDWLADSTNDSASRKMLGEIWIDSEIVVQGQNPDVERLLKSVRYRIHSGMIQNKPETSLKFLILDGWRKVAAVLFIPIFLLTAYLLSGRFIHGDVDQHVQLREVYTKPGTLTHIQLPDGTLVWLNDGTTIKYPERFTGKERVVFLDGEAYFEVKSNPKEPFIVENSMMKTRVTGTHFNLNAYSADRFFEATLLEGRIELFAQSKHVDLSPGQQLQFNVDQNIFQRKNVRSDDAAAWIHGKLVFYNEKLDVVIRKLSRWYNVDIQFNDSLLCDYDLTYTLQNEKLEQSLNYISQVLPVNYSYSEIKHDDKTEQRIILTRK